MSTPRRKPSPVPKPLLVDEIRKSVAGLGRRGFVEVEAVRTAFIEGIPPLQTAGSGSKADFIGRFSDDAVGANITKSTAQFGLASSPIIARTPAPKPELDFVEVANDPNFGTLDSFYTRVVFSIATSELSKISHFRVLRAVRGVVEGLAKPSFSALIDGTPTVSRSKSTELISNFAFRAADIGVGNRLTDSIADDYFSRQRIARSSGTLRVQPKSQRNSNRGEVANSLLSLDGADRSVLENVDFYVNRRTLNGSTAVELPLLAGNRQGVNVLQGSTISTPSAIVPSDDSHGFFEVARIATVPTRIVGSYAEFEYYDPAVIHGTKYGYYVVAVSRSSVDATRSRIVSVDIANNRPPTSPQVFYSVVQGIPRFSIACSGTFLDHVEVFRKGGRLPAKVGTVGSGLTNIGSTTPAELDSGFTHIGDIGLNSDKSSIFLDRGLKPGDAVNYRLYTVDSFGLKSLAPFSCSLKIPDLGLQIPSAIPSITAEQVSSGRQISISLTIDDERMTAFVLSRRDHEIHENSFRSPSTPDYFMHGAATTPKRSRSRFGPTLNQNSNSSWNGILSIVSGSASFIDQTVQLDRKYQYSVYAVDSRGNVTSPVVSMPIFVSTKPILDMPIGLTGTVTVDSSGIPTGVMLSWRQGTLDFSPSDLVGNQDDLSATSQRSIFQVERREVGTATWEALPPSTGTTLFDQASASESPKFRPQYVKFNTQYDYRVIAMQSGGFISQHTQPVRVAVVPEISAPGRVWVKTTPTSARPLHVVISWQYDGIFIDSWQIERAITNKIFGSKVISMDSSEARSLDYRPFGQVMRESSRAHGLFSSISPVIARSTGGNRLFIDRDVSLANSYFYRIRAVSSIGNYSDWVYAGISLADSPFDRKFISSLSDDEKVKLSLDPRPIQGWSRE